jgi:hypothetical protein
MNESGPQVPNNSVSQESREYTINTEEVIASLIENPGDYDLLQRFISEREENVRNAVDQIWLSIEIGEVQWRAGFAEYARDTFLSAAEQASYENDPELEIAVEKKIAELSGIDVTLPNDEQAPPEG